MHDLKEYSKCAAAHGILRDDFMRAHLEKLAA